jgi:hypothetical protein
MRRCIFAVALSLWLSFASSLIGQDVPKTNTAGRARVSALWDDLATPMSAEPFVQVMALKDAIDTIQKQFQQHYGHELPITINQQAFKDEAPEAPDLLECQIKLNAHPRTRTIGQLLRAMLSQASDLATIYVYDGTIEITTHDAIIPARLLQQTPNLRFTRQPLSFVLEEIHDRTGVYVILDRRVGVNARTPVSMTFTNDLTLGTGLRLMAEMAHLKLLVIDNTIVITTPDHARQLVWEILNNPYLLPAFWPNGIKQAARLPLPNGMFAGK